MSGILAFCFNEYEGNAGQSLGHCRGSMAVFVLMGDQ